MRWSRIFVEAWLSFSLTVSRISRYPPVDVPFFQRVCMCQLFRGDRYSGFFQVARLLVQEIVQVVSGESPGIRRRLLSVSRDPSRLISRITIVLHHSGTNCRDEIFHRLKFFANDNLRHKSVSFVLWKVCERFVRPSGFIGSIRFENPVDERYYSPRDTKRAHSAHKFSMTQRSRRFATTGIFIVSLRKGIYHGKSTRAWTRAAL